MSKRILSSLIVLTMLLTTVCMPVSASTGIIADKTIAASRTFYNDGSTTTGVTAAKGLSCDGSKLTFDTTAGALQQLFVKNLAVDTASEDTFGYMAFKLNVDSATASNSGAVFSIACGNTGAEQVPVVAVNASAGYIGMTDTTQYNAWGSLSEGVKYNAGQWYTIGAVIKKNQTFDLYIDGVFQKTVKLEGSGKTLATDKSTFYLFENQIAGAKMHLDDITWAPYSDSCFIAESSTTVASGGDTMKVKFSQPVAKVESSKIKLYNCQTGAEVSGMTSALSKNVLELILPNGLEAGAEYRAELDGVTGVLGTKPYNDNIYFNCPLETSVTTTDYIAAETFESYADQTVNGTVFGTDYCAPEGWYLAKKWNNQTNGFIRSKATDDAEHGTAMQIGQGSTAEALLHAYLPLNEDVTSGTLTISYDLKPEKYAYYDREGTTNNNNCPSAGLFVMIYPDGIAESDKTWKQGGSDSIGKVPASATAGVPYGRIISGVIGTSLGSPTGDVGADTAASRSQWKAHKTFGTGTNDTGDLNEKWYTVKIEIDFDNDTMKWYLDGELKDTNTALMDTLNIDGAYGISFGFSGRSLNISQLIDNVYVTKTYNKELSAETEIFSDNFNDFENDGAKATYLWKKPTDDGLIGYAPKGWAVHRIWETANQHYGSISTSAVGKDGNGYKLGKNVLSADSKNEAPVAYHKLDKVYDSGIINISYDIKGEKLLTTNDYETFSTNLSGYGATLDGWGLTTAATNGKNVATIPFALSLTPDSINDTGLSNNVFAYMSNNDGVKDSNLGQSIFTIQNGKFCANTSPVFKWSDTANTEGKYTAYYDPYKITVNNVVYEQNASYRKDVTLNQWYNVKHVVDLTEGYIKTYIDDALVGIARTDEMGVSKVGGVTFGAYQNAYDSEVVIDNVKVAAQNWVENPGGVMQVRFSDYYDTAYGTGTTLTTLTDCIGVAFWSKDIDKDSFDVNSVHFIDVDHGNREVGYSGSFSDDGIYLMNLKEYLTKDTTYKLLIDGVTANGQAIGKYEQTIKSDAEGKIVVEPMYIWKNASDVTGSASGTLAKDDTITAGTRIINTTGETKNYAFSMGVYDGSQLKYFDFREVSMDGKTDGANKEANISCSFTLSEDDAKDITSIKTFLWDGMDTMRSVTAPAVFSKTTESGE